MKFYSTINQAVQRAEVDYGDKKYWYQDLTGAEFDKDGNPVPGSSKAEKWFNKYLTPYMKIIKTDTLSDGTFIVYFPDGSALRMLQNATTRDWVFYPGNPDKCIKKYGTAYNNGDGANGICSFAFNYRPLPAINEPDVEKWKYHINKGFEPWKFNWDGKRSTLLSRCTAGKDNATYCTALIQMNNWKIPDDYPYKVSY